MQIQAELAVKIQQVNLISPTESMPFFICWSFICSAQPGQILPLFEVAFLKVLKLVKVSPKIGKKNQANGLFHFAVKKAAAQLPEKTILYRLL